MDSDRALREVERQLGQMALSAGQLEDETMRSGHVRIRVESLGKQYRRSLTSNVFPIPFLPGSQSGEPGDWALHDVGFSVVAGSVVGLIGADGAGKTTLLRILGRAIPPTTGYAELRGRVIPMLSLKAAPFSEDDTALTNARLSAQLYGIPTSVPTRNISAIIKATGVAAHPDLKLKHYSSGMRKRLSIAIPIHLDPDVLLVDDLFGDNGHEFRRESLLRIKAAARRHGTAALVASHDLGAMRAFCDRVLWLEQGHLVDDGPPDGVISRYERTAKKRLAKRNARRKRKNVERRRRMRTRLRDRVDAEALLLD